MCRQGLPVCTRVGSVHEGLKDVNVRRPGWSPKRAKVVGRFAPLAVINQWKGAMAPKTTDWRSEMDRRVRITLPEPLVRRLEGMAEDADEPVSRVAAQFV